MHSRCTFSTPWGAFRPVAILQARTCQLKHNYCRIRPGPHLYTWVESSNNNNHKLWLAACLRSGAWRTVAGIGIIITGGDYDDGSRRPGACDGVVLGSGVASSKGHGCNGGTRSAFTDPIKGWKILNVLQYFEMYNLSFTHFHFIYFHNNRKWNLQRSFLAWHVNSVRMMIILVHRQSDDRAKNVHVNFPANYAGCKSLVSCYKIN